jgi:predicted DNA-binding transcriptional regulator AlpA
MTRARGPSDNQGPSSAASGHARRLRTPDEAAAFLQVPVRQLQQWRWLKVGPAYVKIGRAVRYRQSDLDAYIEAHRVEPREAL